MLHGQSVEGHIQYAAAVVAVTGIIATDVAAAASADAAAVSKTAAVSKAAVAATACNVVASAAWLCRTVTRC